MKFLVISLLSVSLLFATVYDGTTEDLDIDIETGPITCGSELQDCPDGTTCMAAPGAVIETLSDEIPFGLTYSSPIERALSRRDEGFSTMPDFDWSNDVEIYPGAVGSGQDFDVDETTGDIYAIYDTDHDGTTTNDSVIVYRSQDGGATWSFWRATYSAYGELNDPKIRVAMDASGQPWVYMLYISVDGLMTRRLTTDQSSGGYEFITTDVTDFADMDADIWAAAYVYVTWVPNGTNDVYFARNAIDGSGWVNSKLLYHDTIITSTPAIAAGAGGTVAVAFIDSRNSTLPQVRIKRSTDYGANWLVSAQVSNSAATMVQNCDIAFSHNGIQVGWITLTFNYSDDNFGYYYSIDSGANWSFGSVFAGAGEENLGSIRARKASGDLAVAYNSDPGSDVMFTSTLCAVPQGFSTPVAINEFPATRYWPAAAGWNGNGSSSVLYTNHTTNYRLMFDWNGNTGIEDGISAGLDIIQNAPNPFNATTNISFNLANSSPVTISIYNVAGQLVSTLADNQSFNEGSHSVQWDGQSFSPGVYFCHLSADGISQTHRMLMVR